MCSRNGCKEITLNLDCPTIGIGAGRYTDAQVLVCYDILGLNNNPPKFVKNFLSNSSENQKRSIIDAFANFKKDVNDGIYPSIEHLY